MGVLKYGDVRPIRQHGMEILLMVSNLAEKVLLHWMKKRIHTLWSCWSKHTCALWKSSQRLASREEYDTPMVYSRYFSPFFHSHFPISFTFSSLPAHTFFYPSSFSHSKALSPHPYVHWSSSSPAIFLPLPFSLSCFSHLSLHQHTPPFSLICTPVLTWSKYLTWMQWQAE